MILSSSLFHSLFVNGRIDLLIAIEEILTCASTLQVITVYSKEMVGTKRFVDISCQKIKNKDRNLLSAATNMPNRSLGVNRIAALFCHIGESVCVKFSDSDKWPLTVLQDRSIGSRTSVGKTGTCR